ncbi:MAG: hypothetical protein ACWA41_04655 [Putridiphycobacter sp.]
MKNFIILISLVLLLGCSRNEGVYWQKIPINNGNYNKQILNVKNEIIFIVQDIKNNRCQILFSKNKGNNWEIVGTFNEFTQIFYFNNSSILINESFLYENDVQYKFNFKLNKLEKIQFNKSYSGYLEFIVSDNDSVVCFKNNKFNNFGEQFIFSFDSGKTWQEKHVLMEDKHDSFMPYCIFKGKLWGVSTHLPIINKKGDYQKEFFVSIDINSLQIIEKIEVGKFFEKSKRNCSTNKVIDLKAIENEIFVLTYDEVCEINCYLNRFDASEKKLMTVDSIEMVDGDRPNSLFDLNNIVIVKQSGFYNEYFLYRKEKSIWLRNNLLINSDEKVYFSGGVLSKINKKNSILISVENQE